MTEKQTKQSEKAELPVRKPLPSWLRKAMWVSGIILVLFLAWSTLPPRWNAAPTLPQVTAKVTRSCTVTRDAYDVPHVEAQSKEALFFCWGKMHALDRGWQMDFLRRRAYGRVGEVYGEHYVKDDFLIRLLRLKKVADRWLQQYKASNSPTYRLLRFYVWGVNQGWKQLKKSQNIPYIWKKHNYFPPAWTVRDALVLSLLQSFYQTRKTFTDDLTHARYRMRLGEVRYRQLFPVRKGVAPFSVPIIKPGEHPLTSTQKHPVRVQNPTSQPALRPSTPASQPVPKRTDVRTMSKTRLAGLVNPYASFSGIGGGSNSWVVAPKRTKEGYALLANDPHLRIRTPAFWYEIHLKGAGVNVMGIGVPGMPILVSGNNEHVAFGITNGFSNASDIVRIRPNPKGEFKLGGRTYRIRAYRPVVWMKKGPFHFPIFWKSFGWTKLGPILPLRSRVGEVLLLRWTGFHVESSPFSSIYKLLRAQNVQQANEALKQWTLPNWNIVFADVHGGIGYRQVGLVAKRTAGYRGFLNGRDPKQLWKGFLNPNEMPHVLNPKKGFIVTANNHAFPGKHRHFLGHAYSKGYRARRIESMLNMSKQHTIQTMQKIQSDTRVPSAGIVLKAMVQKLPASKQLKPLERTLLARLQKWDHQSRKNQIEPTLYRVWFRLIEKKLFRYDIVRTNSPTPRTKRRSKKKATFVFRPGTFAVLKTLQGKIETIARFSIKDVVYSSFQEAIKKLRKDLGTDWKTWTWGRYHTLSFFHLSGRTSPLHPPAQAMDGEQHTVSPGKLRGNGPFSVRNAASYRLVVQLKPGRIRSWGVLAGKQIDKDPKVLGSQQKLWLKHQYRKRLFYPDELKPFKKNAFKIQF